MFLLSLNLFLLLANFAWVCWNGRLNSIPYWAVKHFHFERFRDNNGVLCFGINDAKTGRLVLTERHLGLGDDGMPAEFDYYCRGTNVLDVFDAPGRLPLYQFEFHGPGKSQVWWLNSGGGSFFTQRISYDTNGVLSKNELWYDRAWHSVDRRNGTNGIVINGQWHRIRYDTNHMVTTGPDAGAP